MSVLQTHPTHRERELGAMISAYNEVTERLKGAHDRLAAEVRRLRRQIQEKNRELARRERLAALGEMAAGVAHEIRNPLAGIKLYADLLITDLTQDSANQQVAHKISNGVRSLDSIVGEILAFAGGSEPQLECVGLGEVVAECLELAKPKIGQAKITVDRSLNTVFVRADRGQLQQALLNLLLNAVQAVGKAGAVSLAGRVDEGGFYVIRIEDNGPGVPDALKDKVFNPFFTTKDSGTGLGLAIVHRIAESHGGSIRVIDSKCGGAMMLLKLPLWDAAHGDSGEDLGDSVHLMEEGC